MPADAFQTVQMLSQHLGRAPTMEELLMYAGSDPSGTPVPPPSPVLPSLRLPEHGDGPLTALLQAQDLMDANPEILQIREQMVKMLLFGPLAPGLSPAAAQGFYGYAQQGGGGPAIPVRTTGTRPGQGANAG